MSRGPCSRPREELLVLRWASLGGTRKGSSAHMAGEEQQGPGEKVLKPGMAWWPA